MTKTQSSFKCRVLSNDVTLTFQMLKFSWALKRGVSEENFYIEYDISDLRWFGIGSITWQSSSSLEMEDPGEWKYEIDCKSIIFK